LNDEEESMRAAIVFPHVGYCTGYRPHLSTEVKHGATYHIPQCLNYLYSISTHFADSVKVIDFNFRTYEDNIATVSQYQPDVILISSTMNSYESTRGIAQHLSKVLRHARIYVGGPAVSSNYNLRPSLLTIDCECSFVPTSKDIFAWTEQVFGRRSDFYFNTFVPSTKWIGETYSKDTLEKLRYTVITSLGCSFNCNFCLNPVVYKMEYKDVSVLKRELEEMKTLYGASAISVADPYFFMHFEHARKVMRCLHDLGLRWSQQTCLVTLTDENLKLMHETGCTSVLVGIENFFSTEIDKPVNKAHLEDRLDRANSLNIKIKPSFIAGLLDIDYETDVKQISYVKSLIDRGKLANDQIQSNIYTPYIPDKRDRLLNVPYRYWGIFPVTAQNVEDWKEKVQLCDLIYREIFPETTARYDELREEYLAQFGTVDDMWLEDDCASSMSGGGRVRFLRKADRGR